MRRHHSRTSFRSTNSPPSGNSVRHTRSVNCLAESSQPRPDSELERQAFSPSALGERIMLVFRATPLLGVLVILAGFCPAIPAGPRVASSQGDEKADIPTLIGQL